MTTEPTTLVAELDKEAARVKWPTENSYFDMFQADLKRALSEICGVEVSRTLTYCTVSQTFQVRIREEAHLPLHLEGNNKSPDMCNLIFECVKTINPRQPIAAQLDNITSLLSKVTYKYITLVDTFQKQQNYTPNSQSNEHLSS